MCCYLRELLFLRLPSSLYMYKIICFLYDFKTENRKKTIYTKYCYLLSEYGNILSLSLVACLCVSVWVLLLLLLCVCVCVYMCPNATAEN